MQVKNTSDWSEGLKELTKKILEDIVLESFISKNRCHMKNSGKAKFHYGYITFSDALAKKYRIYDRESESFILYSSIQRLIDDGWVVD